MKKVLKFGVLQSALLIGLNMRKIIKKESDLGNKIIVVVSAMAENKRTDFIIKIGFR